ncbi:hypothetical protein PR048_001210 [Dryococelus australis]|uniref:Uncharacterized protein n=1 Tax=Dryococelus australis TaxID=614101 RepID=A0ABQ9II70_9NEOP|nr:hypothetical protein PR048_001210 [Dryococelus australis]
MVASLRKRSPPAKINTPDIDSTFKQGLFVVQKSRNVSSDIGLDQAHEQNNAIIKGDGGAVGLLTDPAALRRCMLGGPEITQLIAEFEESNATVKETLYMRHEQTPEFQNIFAQKVIALKNEIKERGNPYLETSNDMFSLETDIAVDKENVEQIMHAEEVGQKQCTAYVNDRIVTKQLLLYSRIKKNIFMLF